MQFSDFQNNKTKYCLLTPILLFLYSDQSQSDSSSKDFWMNMQAITVYLKKLSEQNPSASYYNVDVLKYQVNSFFPLELVKEVWRFGIYTEIKIGCSLDGSMQMNSGCVSVYNTEALPRLTTFLLCFRSFPWIHELLQPAHTSSHVCKLQTLLL